MTDIILCGCCGHMGSTISELCENDSSVNIVAGVDAYDSGKTAYPVFKSFENLDRKADVIIDFSNPSVLDSMLSYAQNTHTPVVIATTGYDEEQLATIKAAAEKVAIFFTFNMSLGINLMCSLARTATKVLGESFDIEIIEKHHNQKIDAPSGTAIMLANAISEELEQKPLFEYDRHSKRAKRPKNEIGIHSVRGGTIVGEHEIIFAGTDEVVSIKHQAMSKKVFAAGAVNAAKFLKGKQNGMYSMEDIIQ
ncbi:MAG: 4-hydroxy-tetrahydrodipicolinate reductase [Clostridia bacterium]|nr:4-hydroxy-tetrahydrodipicolinate reductase [Clostridia bacterium]